MRWARELTARIQAMLRRPRSTTAAAPATAVSPPRRFGDLSLDVNGREGQRRQAIGRADPHRIRHPRRPRA